MTAETGGLDGVPVTIIGHPFAAIGMGEQMRSHIAACMAVHVRPGVYDIFRYAQRVDPAYHALVGPLECDSVPGGIRVFHINGDEIDNVLGVFEARGNVFADGRNIVVPAWELPAYPKAWAKKLRRFDEVWALSAFIQRGLAAAGIESHLVGQSIDLPSGPCQPRRHFGLRESAFVLLNFFDLSSYATRKNPEAVLRLMRRIRAEHPFLDVELALKVKNGERAAEEWAAALPPDQRMTVISAPLDTAGIRGLMTACDCFVSLHRAEGFGRGLGEAMRLGRLALGTGWSGNLDFMTAENSLLVRAEQVRLKPGEYPHWRGQSWAEPDVDHAYELLRPVLLDRALGREIAVRGQADVFRTHGNRAVGLRLLDRMQAIIPLVVE